MNKTEAILKMIAGENVVNIWTSDDCDCIRYDAKKMVFIICINGINTVADLNEYSREGWKDADDTNFKVGNWAVYTYEGRKEYVKITDIRNLDSHFIYTCKLADGRTVSTREERISREFK